MKLSFQTCENFIVHHQLQCKQISDYQAFQSTQRTNIIHGDNFLLHHAVPGVQSHQKLGAIGTPLLQRRSATAEISIVPYGCDFGGDGYCLLDHSSRIHNLVTSPAPTVPK